jgi:general nucleoside transport system permease protein
MMDLFGFLANLIAATFRVSTPILLAATGETYSERSGVLNLGIEGTMLFGAFIGFFVADKTGSLWTGLMVAIAAGVLSGLLMGLLTVTLGVN